MKWREKKKNIKRNERNPAKKKGTMQLKNWKKLQYYKIPTNKIKTFGFMVFHSFVWFVVLLFRFFFIHFFKPQVAINSFIKFVCYLFVCVRFWLFTSSTSMNIYIENILFPWYYTLKPSIAFPFKFLLDFSLFLLLLSLVIFGLKQN